MSGWDSLIQSAYAPPPSWHGGSGGGSVSPDTFVQGLVDRGIDPVVAQGLVPNVQDESGFDPGINEKNPTVAGSRGGFGLLQWTGPRRRQLEQFAAQNGTSPGDVNTQLDFTAWELQNTEKSAYQKALAAGAPNAAAAVLVNDYLRPNEKSRAARAAKYLGGTEGYAPQAHASGNRLWLDLGA